MNFNHPTPDAKPVALITGGAQRLGRYITNALRHTHRVIVHYWESVDNASALKSSSADIITIQGDLTMPGAPARLIEQAIAEAGQLDLLVNNAALFFSDTATLVNLAKMKSLNLDAPIKLIETARPHLANQNGHIINIADIAAIHNFGKYKAYSRSKAALLQHAANHALDFAREQIRINTVCPGLVLPSASDQTTDSLDVLQQQIPLKRIGKPEDVADLVAFLANSTFITGQVIAVDGGRLLNYTASAPR
ncbi:MAG: SDR family oxidoreductase [Deltaproteobacteria bacterium]|nr:SDR family oxidoreductase [Deltaproteobacteria bacterium]